jgi:RimJ/RimL family protein N-acetyltransferase
LPGWETGWPLPRSAAWMRFMWSDLTLDLGDGLYLRALVSDDAALLAEATSGETARSLWGPRPAGPYSLPDARVALAAWNPAAGGQFSLGVLGGQQLLGAVGLMPDQPGSAELACWIRPEQRGRGLASRAVQAVTLWAHRSLAIPPDLARDQPRQPAVAAGRPAGRLPLRTASFPALPRLGSRGCRPRLMARLPYLGPSGATVAPVPAL